MELEKLVREFQQVHADLFSRAQSLSDSMLRLSDSNAPKSNASKQTDVGSPPRNLRSADSAPQRVEQSQFASLGPLDEETRPRLENTTSISWRCGSFSLVTSLMPAAHLDTVYLLVRCVSGLADAIMSSLLSASCPIGLKASVLCAAVALLTAVFDGIDESDRCSSVSTSVSQRAKRVFPAEKCGAVLGMMELELEALEALEA